RVGGILEGGHDTGSDRCGGGTVSVRAHTLADVRELAVGGIRVLDLVARDYDSYEYGLPVMTHYDEMVDTVVALLRTPRGEGETMDADEMWNHWTSGHEDAALLGLRTASDDEAHRFLSMLADWQRCPKPSDHDAIA